MDKIIVFLIFALFFYSCKKSSQNILKEKISQHIDEKIDFSNTNYFSEKFDSTIIINVPHPEEGELKLNNLIEEIKFTPLEIKGEKSKIGAIDKIINDQGFYFLLDKEITKSVFIFDENGKFISNLGEKGKGPKEYLHPTDISNDSINKLIIIYDNILNKLLFFSYEGKFVKEIYLDEILLLGNNNFHFYEENKFLITSNNSIDNESIEKLAFNLKMINKEGKILSKHFPANELNLLLPYESTNMFSKFNNGYNYVSSLENKVYHLKDKEITSKYKINFGSNGMPKGAYNLFNLKGNNQSLKDKILSRKNLIKHIQKNNYSHAVNTFLETKQHIHYVFQ